MFASSREGRVCQTGPLTGVGRRRRLDSPAVFFYQSRGASLLLSSPSSTGLSTWLVAISATPSSKTLRRQPTPAFPKIARSVRFRSDASKIERSRLPSTPLCQDSTPQASLRSTRRLRPLAELHRVARRRRRREKSHHGLRRRRAGCRIRHLPSPLPRLRLRRLLWPLRAPSAEALHRCATEPWERDPNKELTNRAI